MIITIVSGGKFQNRRLHHRDVSLANSFLVGIGILLLYNSFIPSEYDIITTITKVQGFPFVPRMFFYGRTYSPLLLSSKVVTRIYPKQIFQINKPDKRTVSFLYYQNRRQSQQQFLRRTMSSSSSSDRIMNKNIDDGRELISNPIIIEIKIAIIGGGGAAGLATARALQKRQELLAGSTNVRLNVISFEKTSSIGGVWNYQNKHSQYQNNNNNNSNNDSNNIDGDANHPMYQNLRTNLPKELMAYKEYPWINSTDNRSFVTHYDVLQYLINYAKQHSIDTTIQYGCTVQQLTILESSDSTVQLKTKESLPKLQLQWTKDLNSESTDDKNCCDIFDGVIICNGHYNMPLVPNLDGIEYFKGTVLHSINYDKPETYVGQSVLCIGARASGSDIAREISVAAATTSSSDSTTTNPTTVYLSDSSYPNAEPITKYGVTLVPRTKCILPDGTIQFDYNCPVTPQIDVILFCSGYNYDFPFINNQSNIQLDTTNRRVRPLYKQLWHAQYPNIAFIGLPHSILPFPFFELQASAIAHQWTVSIQEGKQVDAQQIDDACSSTTYYLPDCVQREKEAEFDALSGGPEPHGRVPQDTHYLGSYQWDYCRVMSKFANTYSDSLEKYIQTNKAIYDHASEARKFDNFPASPDIYRSLLYTRHNNNGVDDSFSVIHADEPVKIYVSPKLLQEKIIQVTLPPVVSTNKSEEKSREDSVTKSLR